LFLLSICIPLRLQFDTGCVFFQAFCAVSVNWPYGYCPSTLTIQKWKETNHCVILQLGVR
jgi:hypothetical protein